MNRDAILSAGRVIVHAGKVRIPAGPTAQADAPSAAETPAPAGRKAPAKPSDQPEVELVRGRDGVIRAIVVRCTCGRELRLQCEYEPPAAADGG